MYMWIVAKIIVTGLNFLLNPLVAEGGDGLHV
jgi:hypothetical protein